MLICPVQLHSTGCTIQAPSRGGTQVTRRITLVVVALLCSFGLSINLHAQGDVVQQIKELQQQSRDAQMKNDASWAQQHLADGYVAGNSWGDWETKDDFIKDLQNKTDKWKSGDISEVQSPRSVQTLRYHITR